MAYAARPDFDDADPLWQTWDASPNPAVDAGQPIGLEKLDSKGEAGRSPCDHEYVCGCYAQGYSDALLSIQPPASDTLLDQARRAATEVALSAGAEVRQTQGRNRVTPQARWSTCGSC